MTLNALAGSWTNVNRRATKEASEPNHAGQTGGASIWFKWTPTNSGVAAIDTLGSAFHTVLAVYTGGAVSSLTLVGSNNDTELNRPACNSAPRRIGSR